MAEVDVDERMIQEKLNSIAAVVVGKRRVAVQEVERRAAIEKKERKTTMSVDKALDFDSIVKKSNTKPRKKAVAPAAGEMLEGAGEALGGERGE